jgi:hypothetical protein
MARGFIKVILVFAILAMFTQAKMIKLSAHLQSSKSAVKAAATASNDSKDLKKAPQTKESVSTAAAKVQLELRKKPDLDHVKAPKGGLTDAEKAAYLEERKGGKK